jgi:hypothetical protein
MNDNYQRFYQVHSYIKRQRLLQPLAAAAMNSRCNGVGPVGPFGASSVVEAKSDAREARAGNSHQ